MVPESPSGPSETEFLSILVGFELPWGALGTLFGRLVHPNPIFGEGSLFQARFWVDFGMLLGPSGVGKSNVFHDTVVDFRVWAHL